MIRFVTMLIMTVWMVFGEAAVPPAPFVSEVQFNADGNGAATVLTEADVARLKATSATAPISYDPTNGTISISAASGSTSGYLTSSDWMIFNGKQNALTAGTGIGISGATISNTFVGANPSATINGTATNGSATTFLRSDAAPALANPLTPAGAEQSFNGALRIGPDAGWGIVFEGATDNAHEVVLKAQDATSRDTSYTFLQNSNASGNPDRFVAWSSNAWPSAGGFSHSVFLGRAGNDTTTAGSNIVIGSGLAGAGGALTIGGPNILVGPSTGNSLTEGSQNIFMGSESGNSATTMQQGVLIGMQTGKNATTGIANVGVGESALYNITTGRDNVGVGSDSLSSSSAGGDNQFGVTTGNHNTGVGNNAGRTWLGTDGSDMTQTGSNNSAFGMDAGWSASPASYRTAIGSGSLSTANNQVMLGRPADTVVMPGAAQVDGVLTTNNTSYHYGSNFFTGVASFLNTGFLVGDSSAYPVINSEGSCAGTDLLVRIGDLDAQGNGTTLVVNDGTNVVSVNGGLSVSGGIGGVLTGTFASTTQPTCSVYAGAAQSIAHLTETAVLFSNETFDVGSIHSTVSNTSRLTAPSTGTYLVTYSVNWVASATGVRMASLKVGGTTSVHRVDTPATSGTYRLAQTGSEVLQLSSGQYVEVVVYQDTGGALSIGDAGSVRKSTASMTKLF